MLLLSALAACTPEEPGRSVRSAEAAACLQPPPGATPTESNGELTLFSVEGQATGDNAADGETFDWGIRCEDVVRVVTITDAEGGEWRLGYGWKEGNKDETPQVDLQPLSPVTLIFRDVESHGGASGFVLREAGRLAAALEVGAWGPALTGDDLPDVVVGEGDVTGSDSSGDCGRRVARELRFVADTEVSLEAVSFDTVIVEGQQLTVWALASWGWEDLTCTDLAGELSFAIWRTP